MAGRVRPRRWEKLEAKIAAINEVEPRVLSLPEERSQHDAERGTALKKFDDARCAYDANRESSGLNATNTRQEELYDIQWDAEKAALRAQPCSAAGASVLLLFTAEMIAASWVQSTSCQFL